MLASLPGHHTVMFGIHIVLEERTIIGDKNQVGVPQQQQLKHVIEIVGIILGAISNRLYH